MNNANAKSASTKSTTISDAEMASVLGNSNWAKMERCATNAAANAVQKCAQATAVKIEIAAPAVQRAGRRSHRRWFREASLAKESNQCLPSISAHRY